MVIVGVAGGVIAFINAVTTIKDALSGGSSCWTTMFWGQKILRGRGKKIGGREVIFLGWRLV